MTCVYEKKNQVMSEILIVNHEKAQHRITNLSQTMPLNIMMKNKQQQPYKGLNHRILVTTSSL